MSRSVRGRSPIIDKTVPSGGAVAARAPLGIRAARLRPSRNKVSALVVAVVMFASFMAVLMSYSGPMAYTPHSPIVINEDADFEGADFAVGTGSESDPYVISGLEIEGTTESIGISIESTTVHFLITGVHITGAAGSLDTGISLSQVTNATVEDCVFDGLAFGIWSTDSVNVSLNSSTFTDCVAPINVRNAQRWAIQDNTMDGTTSGEVGIFLYDAYQCDISGNIVSDFLYEGISSTYAHECSYSSNEVSGSSSAPGMYMASDCGDCEIHDNVLTGNNDGWNRGGGVCLDGCGGILVYHNSFYGNTPSQAYDSYVTGNQWYKDSTLGGNYWDDHTGDDDNSDTFYDQPYEIADEGSEESNSWDMYPLMTPPSGTPIPEFTSVVVPVFAVMALFLVVHRRRSA